VRTFLWVGAFLVVGATWVSIWDLDRRLLRIEQEHADLRADHARITELQRQCEISVAALGAGVIEAQERFAWVRDALRIEAWQ
jgi:type II secretory pathway component PulM